MRWRIAVASALLAPKSKVTQSATAQTAACLRHRYVHADRTGSRSSAPGYATRPTHTVTDARQPVVTMRVARASAWSQTLRNPLQLPPKLAAVIDDATPHARFPGARSPQRCPMPGSPRRATRGRPRRPRRPADQRAVAKAGAAASLHGAQAPPSSSAGLTSTRRATRMNPRRVADSSGHPTPSPGRGCSVALSVRSSELRTSRRSLALRTSSPMPHKRSTAVSAPSSELWCLQLNTTG